MREHIDAFLHSQLLRLSGKVHLELNFPCVAGEEFQTCPILITFGSPHCGSEHMELDCGELLSVSFLLIDRLDISFNSYLD